MPDPTLPPRSLAALLQIRTVYPDVWEVQASGGAKRGNAGRQRAIRNQKTRRLVQQVGQDINSCHREEP